MTDYKGNEVKLTNEELELYGKIYEKVKHIKSFEEYVVFHKGQEVKNAHWEDFK